MIEISKLKSDLELETAVLDEIEAILREMGSHEAIYVRIPTKSPGYNGMMPPGIPE